MHGWRNAWHSTLAKAETVILNRIRVALSGLAVTFRNHVGMLRDERGQVHKFGLFKGSSDLIGWQSVTVTPDMVGQRVAVFVAIEVKTPTGRVSREQQTFIDRVREAGGRAGVARSPEEALTILQNGMSSPGSRGICTTAGLEGC